MPSSLLHFSATRSLLILLVLSPSSSVGAYSFQSSSFVKRNSLSCISSSSLLKTSYSSSPRLFSNNVKTPSSSLSMHMGHSHSHHQHQEQQQTQTTTPPKTLGGHILRVSRRPVARVIFAALVVFVPALIRRLNRRNWALSLLIKRSDIAAFLAISASLSFADGIRREFQRIVDRVLLWKQGFLKHAPKMTLEAPSAAAIWDGMTSSSDTKNSNKQTEKSREQAADRVTVLGVLINVLLSIGKLAVGITCHSSALVADAGHSLSDLFSDFITLWAVQIARLPPDDDHPYGHGKFEAVGALFLALTLLGTGLSVGGVSYGKLLDILKAQKAAAGSSSLLASAVQVPTFPALIMAFLSIASKEWLYRITRRVGEALNSQVVLANAWHHRSDAYSSVLALVSIALAMLVPGLLAADSAAGLLVGGMICMTGAEIMGEAIKQLTDTSADDGLVERAKKLALNASDDVLDVQRIRTRQMGSKVIVDVSITTPESLSTSATKQVEDRVKYCILKYNSNVVDAEVRATSMPSTTDTIAAGDKQLLQEPPVELDPQDHDHHSHSHINMESSGDSEMLSETDMQASSSSSATVEDNKNGASSSSLEIGSDSGSASSEDFLSEEDAHQIDIDMPEPAMFVNSFQEVEDDARQLLNEHSSVRSVEGCTVHYNESSQQVHVDVTIQLENPEWTTVTVASALAKELKIVLQEGSSNIHKANIFLDLNNSNNAPEAPLDIIERAVQAQNLSSTNNSNSNPNNFRTKQQEITKRG